MGFDFWQGGRGGKPISDFADKGEGGKPICNFWLTTGVWTTPFLADIICEQPLIAGRETIVYNQY